MGFGVQGLGIRQADRQNPRRLHVECSGETMLLHENLCPRPCLRLLETVSDYCMTYSLLIYPSPVNPECRLVTFETRMLPYASPRCLLFREYICRMRAASVRLSNRSILINTTRRKPAICNTLRSISIHFSSIRKTEDSRKMRTPGHPQHLTL